MSQELRETSGCALHQNGYPTCGCCQWCVECQGGCGQPTCPSCVTGTCKCVAKSADECKHVRCCCFCEFHGAVYEECGECDCCTVEGNEAEVAWAQRHIRGGIHAAGDDGKCVGCVVAQGILGQYPFNEPPAT